MLAQNFEYELKAKNRIQISAEYGISPRVLALRIKKYELDIPQGDILPKHQKVIYEALGYPTDLGMGFLFRKLGVRKSLR